MHPSSLGKTSHTKHLVIAGMERREKGGRCHRSKVGRTKEAVEWPRGKKTRTPRSSTLLVFALDFALFLSHSRCKGLTDCLNRLTDWIDSPRRWQWGGEECGGACCATSARPMRWWGTWSCPPRCPSCFRRNVASAAAQMYFPEVRTTNNCIDISNCCVCSINAKWSYFIGRTLVQSLPGLGRNRDLYAGCKLLPGCWWQRMLDC